MKEKLSDFYPSLEELEREKIIIKKGGISKMYCWEYDEEKEEGEYVEKDLSIGYEFFFYPCYFEPGLLLADLFKYIENTKQIWSCFLGRRYDFISNLIDEINSVKPEEEEDPSNSEIKFFVFGLTGIEKWLSDDYLDVSNFCHFHGFGYPKEEYGGNYVPYSIGLENPGRYRNFDVVIDNELCFFDLTKAHKNRKQILGKYQPSLFQIIYGLIWEVTWYGTGEDRSKKMKEILELKDEIEMIKNDDDI